MHGQGRHAWVIALPCAGVAAVPAVGVRARHRQGEPGGAGTEPLQQKEKGSASRRGRRRSLHLHMLQLHRRLALPRQQTPVQGGATAGPLRHLWGRQRQR